MKEPIYLAYIAGDNWDGGLVRQRMRGEGSETELKKLWGIFIGNMKYKLQSLVNCSLFLCLLLIIMTINRSNA